MKGIYKWENKINGKIYIGQSVNLSSRYNRYKSDSKKEKRKTDRPIDRAMKKYGFSNFDYEILCIIDESVQEFESKELLDKLEIYYISYFNSLINTGHGYNVESGGSLQKIKPKLTFEEKLNLSRTLSSKTIILIQNMLIEGYFIKDIAKKFKINISVVSDINTGKKFKNKKLTYPLNPNSKIESHLKNKDISLNIIYELKNTDLNFVEIADKNKVSLSLVISLNNGKVKSMFNKKEKYPLRVPKQRVLEDIYKKIEYLLMTTDLSCSRIAEEVGVSSTTVRRFNNGKIRKDLHEGSFPIRALDTSRKYKNQREYAQDLKNDLINSDLSFDELSKKYNKSLQTILKINRGVSYKDNSLSYPLRKK